LILHEKVGAVLTLVLSDRNDLSVRRFTVVEAASTLFEITITATSADADVEFGPILGGAAWFRIDDGGLSRVWSGVCVSILQRAAEETGLSTYQVTIAPRLRLLALRRNHRIFQHLSVPDIIAQMLAEWQIEPVWKIDWDSYPKLEQRVQYGETDHAFFCRLLEEAGISFFFEGDLEKGSILVLHDRPQAERPRLDAPLPFLTDIRSIGTACVSRLQIGRIVRPGRLSIRDYDFRRPAASLYAEYAEGPDAERPYEQHHYRPGSFLMEVGGTSDTPFADQPAVVRAKPKAGQRLAKRSLRSERGPAVRIDFSTNVMVLWPGSIFAISGHAHPELAEQKPLLVTEFTLTGEVGQTWAMYGTAVLAEPTFRPPVVTPRPMVAGVQPARVVGPKDAEIHTDEHGRVRVQFVWDREGQGDERASCWLRVSQGWAGPRHGVFMLPRVGHEVLVGFVEGNPDQPIVLGRVHNAAAPPAHEFPARAAVSAWTGASSPRPTPGTETENAGFNQVAFDDTKGAERMVIHAARDLEEVANRAAVEVVGQNATRVIARDQQETVGAGARRITLGVAAEENVKQKRTVQVGRDLRAVVAGDDTRRVGRGFVVEVAPGLGGPQGEVLSGGTTPQNAPALEPAPAMNIFPGDAPAAAPAAAPPAATHLAVYDGRIVLTTGAASIVLDGGDIKLAATGTILFAANERILSTMKINGGPMEGTQPSIAGPVGEEIVAVEGTGGDPVSFFESYGDPEQETGTSTGAPTGTGEEPSGSPFQ
jgi:type VI secretion system secreted protein VgrG